MAARLSNTVPVVHFTPSRSWYQFTDPERMEGLVSLSTAQVIDLLRVDRGETGHAIGKPLSDVRKFFI